MITEKSGMTPVEKFFRQEEPESMASEEGRCAFFSVTGKHHEVNQDCCAHYPSAQEPIFCVVAHGVGGGAFGEVASHTLVQHLAKAPPEVYRDSERLVNWVHEGDTIVRDAIARHGDRPGASTVVALWFLTPRRFHLIHVGDCRAYRLTAKWLSSSYRVTPLTVDQTYGNLQLHAPSGGRPDDPARMIGVGAVGTPPVVRGKLNRGEYLLLCSDGLHKFLDNQAMVDLMAPLLRRRTQLDEICCRLVEAALTNGSHDDISALLIRG